jgi:hypothetical protein
MSAPPSSEFGRGAAEGTATLSHCALYFFFYWHARDVVQSLTPPARVSNISRCGAFTTVALIPLTLWVCRLVDCTHPRRLRHVDPLAPQPVYECGDSAVANRTLLSHALGIHVVVENYVQRNRIKIPTVILIHLAPLRSL